MSNSYFQFKQFRVEQKNTAMKVCTDACILGAFTASKITNRPHYILDIGTGTGLLSLMLAQSFSADTDAVEVDEAAAKQANENFLHSPWKEQLKVHLCSISEFSTSRKYDLIISNPPFFESNLRSDNAAKNLAKHDTGLTFTVLIENISRLLSKEGITAILIPFHRKQELLKTAKGSGLQPIHILDIKNSPNSEYFRSIILLSKVEENIATISTLVIKEINGTYSTNFQELLQDYYLYL